MDTDAVHSAAIRTRVEEYMNRMEQLQPFGRNGGGSGNGGSSSAPLVPSKTLVPVCEALYAVGLREAAQADIAHTKGGDILMWASSVIVGKN